MFLDILILGNHPQRSVVRLAGQRKVKVVRLWQLKRLLTKQSPLETWYKPQHSTAINMKGSIGRSCLQRDYEIRRRGRMFCKYDGGENGQQCQKFARSPYIEWDGFCASHYYEFTEGVASKYEVEAVKCFRARGMMQTWTHNSRVMIDDSVYYSLLTFTT